MKTLLSIVFMLAGIAAFGQQEYSFTNYFEVNPVFNPAATGTKGTQNVAGIFRKQWVGFDGSPITGGIVYDNILKDYNMGLGGYIFTDKVGETSMTNVAANYSYILKLDNQYNLSFGVDAGADIYSTNYDQLIYWDEQDRMFNGAKQTLAVPRAGAGVQFYNDKFYVGFSVPRLMSFNNGSALAINAENMPSIVSNYFLTAGYKFPIGEQFEMQINTLGKYTQHVIPQGDINVLGTYNKLIGFGLGYRSLGFATAMVQYTYDEVVTIGYSFDMSLTKIANYSNGSHEIMVKYALPQKSNVNMFK